MATPSRRSSKSRTARRKVAKVPRLRRCGTMSVHHRLLERDPDFRQRQIALEHACARRMARREFRLAGAPITVPTVVHIVYNTSAENVSDSQVRSQIRVLNQDHAAKNADRTKVPGVWRGLVTDSGFRLALAKKDPNGKSTSGITRTQTTRTEFQDDDSVKRAASGGANAWPARKYLNI